MRAPVSASTTSSPNVSPPSLRRLPYSSRAWICIEAATPAVATEPPAADTTERRLLDLLDPDARQAAAYGSKGANLATLYSLIDPSLTLQGLVVPMAYFADHVEGLDTQVDPNDAVAAAMEFDRNPSGATTGVEDRP